MDERTGKAFRMQFVKGEWLVLEIVGSEHAIIKNENEIDEDVFRRVMQFVKYLFIVGIILGCIAVVVGITIPPYLGGDDEWVYPASGWVFFAAVAVGISMFYYVISAHMKDESTAVVTDKAKGTAQVQHWSGVPMIKPKSETLVDIASIEVKVETVKDSDGPDYDATRIYARDKNDQLTRLYSYSAAKPPEEIALHFNAWFHGEEAGPATYRVPL
jgi:hypothetical protein